MLTIFDSVNEEALRQLALDFLTDGAIVVDINTGNVIASGVTVLDLTRCRQLDYVTLALPALRKFIANSCVVLFHLVLDDCPKLEQLHVSHCKQIKVFTAAGTRSLETLNLFGCRNVPEARVRTLLQNNGATLRQLNLNGALNTVNIEEAEIRKLCPNLRYLDARGRARKY